MGADEIIDWMAYNLTKDQEFLEKLAKTPQKYDDPEEEAAAMKKMLMGLSSKKCQK